MKKAVFYFRDGGVIITEITEEETPVSIGVRLSSGGFICGKDSFWDKPREVVINTADISWVFIYEN